MAMGLRNRILEDVNPWQLLSGSYFLTGGGFSLWFLKKNRNQTQLAADIGHRIRLSFGREDSRCSTEAFTRRIALNNRTKERYKRKGFK